MKAYQIKFLNLMPTKYIYTMKTIQLQFLKKFFLIMLTTVLITSCKEQKEVKETSKTETIEKAPFFKISLAQWSLHKAILDDKTLDAIDFAQKANEMGFEAIEYVSQLYTPQIKTMGMEALLDSLKAKSKKYNVKNLLIMVDGEGELTHKDKKERDKAIENHKKWVDAAAFLGCHSIRLNLFGSDDDVAQWKKYAKESLTLLSNYAKEKNINIIVENHGGFSSNGALLAEVIQNVNLENCGTLPDFGNFCLKREGGKRWNAKCIEEYDMYKGIQELMPFAKGVSAKSHDFDKNGNESTIDYKKMLQIVKDSGFTGFIDVEYEGDKLNEEEGIEATKALLIKVGKELN